jgi:hypothetical protein
MINKLLQFSYAASVATSQAIATFASVRAEQVALSNMTDKQLKNLTPVAQKRAIGFVPSVACDG